MIRGCNKTKNALSENQNLKNSVQQYISDSTKAAQESKDYQDQTALLDGQISLKDEQLQSKSDSLDAANARITLLISKHKPVTPSTDTTATYVPNEYIEDCEGCFVELTRGRQMMLGYKGTADSLLAIYNKRKKADSLRIKGLTNSNSNLLTTLRSANISAAQKEEQLKPRWKALISIGAMFVNSNLPNAVGGGVGYQDKYNRIFSIKYYIYQSGGIKQADVYFPLSFRRKR